MLKSLEPLINSGAWEYTGLKNTIHELTARRRWTPDVFKLQEYKKHTVFVYDSLKSTFQNHKELGFHPVFLGRAVSFEQNFIARRYGSQIMAWKLNKNEGKSALKHVTCPIYGEMYALELHDLMHLDAVMDNGYTFERQRFYFELIDQKTNFRNPRHMISQDAWIYCPTVEFRKKHLIATSLASKQLLRINRGNVQHAFTAWYYNHADQPN